MSAKAERFALFNTVLTFVLAGVMFGLARWSGGAAPLVTAVYLTLAVLISVVAYFHLRLVRLEAEESLEEAQLGDVESEDTSIFSAPDENIEAFTAAHARQQFERYVVPGFTILLFLLHGALAVFLARRMGDVPGIPVDRAAACIALLAFTAFLLFVGGKMQAALASDREYRLLLAPAGYSLLCAGMAFLGTVAAVAIHFKYAPGDRIAAWIGIGGMGLLSVEFLLNFVLEIYRPRTTAEARPLYESRLTELLAHPRGLFEGIAQAVDYQFGFKVSETWFYQLLQQAVLPLLAVQLLSLYLLSCLVFVGPDEVGIRERFGRPDASHVLESGVHWKLPWPVDKVYKFPAKRVLTVKIGGEEKDEHADEHGPEGDRVILWTQSHGDVDYWLVAARDESPLEAHHAPASAGTESARSAPTAPEGSSASSEETVGEPAAVPVNLVSMHAVVQYRITDVFRYAYGFHDAPRIIRDLANREIVKKFVSVDMLELMGPGRIAVAEELRRRLQQRVSELDLGVRITFVGIEGIHPPVTVAQSFENVIGAMEEAETKVLDADVYANRSVPLARAKATATVAAAKGYRLRQVALAEAEAEAFAQHLKAYSVSPGVYRTRTYLDTLERSLDSVRKYVVVSRQARDVTILNLEDKLRPDLLDIPMPGASEEKKGKEESKP